MKKKRSEKRGAEKKIREGNGEGKNERQGEERREGAGRERQGFGNLGSLVEYSL